MKVIDADRFVRLQPNAWGCRSDNTPSSGLDTKFWFGMTSSTTLSGSARLAHPALVLEVKTAWSRRR
jgi:hypothetical protein